MPNCLSFTDSSAIVGQMQVKKLAISDTRVKLSIVADQATLDTIKNPVLKHLAAQHVKLPGFRAGKAPLALVEKHVDPSLLQSEFLEEAVNRMYSQAIRARSEERRVG